MHSQTNEQALEAAIEKQLTGTTLETIKAEGLTVDGVNESGEMYRAGNGYYVGQPSNFNAQFAIDELFFWQFLENTQKEELEKVQRQSDWKLKILNRLDRIIKRYGVLHIHKKGLAVDDAHFTFFYVLPLASSSEAVKENFEKNIFSTTRQFQRGNGHGVVCKWLAYSYNGT